MEEDYLAKMQKKRRIIYAPTQEQVFQKLKAIKDPELRAFAFFSYQTGERISEVKQLKFGDITIQSKDKHRYALVKAPTLKNRRKGIRLLPIPLFVSIEAIMYEYFNSIYSHRIDEIFKHIGSRNNVWYKLKKEVKFSCEVFNLDTKKTEQQEIRLNPHLLRHFRLTHLVQLYQYDAFRLMEFAGWSSTAPAKFYVSLGWQDLAQQFVVGLKNRAT